MRKLFVIVALLIMGVLSSCGTAVPAAAKTFVDAIHRGDNAAARAVETQACLDSFDNNFCLDASFDQKIKDLSKKTPVSFEFVGTYTNVQGDTVVIYRASYTSPVSGKAITDTLVLTVEKKSGKIGYANLSPDAAAVS